MSSAAVTDALIVNGDRTFKMKFFKSKTYFNYQYLTYR